MGILASDTLPEAERVQLDILRAMSPSKKAAVLAGTLRTGLRMKAKSGLRVDGMVEPFEVTGLVVDCLESLGVDYFLGGSMASSLHGEPRYTQDADLIVKLAPHHVPQLAALTEANFYLSQSALQEAITRQASANLIHFESGFKVDLMVWRQRPFDHSRFARRIRFELGSRQIWVSSPEDTALAKLDWYQLGGERSDRQWRDILTLLLTSAKDLNYLESWAQALGLEPLLARALEEIRQA